MARRILALWLPHFAIDRRIKDDATLCVKPLVLVHYQQQRDFTFVVNDEAEKFGIVPGMPLSDARALCLGLIATEADPAADRRALERLTDWCERYTPWVAVDPAAGPGEAGLLLDITGCAHFFGGEAGLLADLARRLTRARLRHRLAVAEAPGAAWAWSRFGPATRSAILAPGEATTALLPLPVEALRVLAADRTALARLGLRRVGDLFALPRAAAAARFGARLLRRLDEALGRCEEPIAPRRPPADFAVRRDFAEPLLVPAGLAPSLARLLVRLSGKLERAGAGARQLTCTIFRIDGTASTAAIGTSRPTRDPAHLLKLFAPKLEALDPDPGIETMLLEAPATEAAAAAQTALDKRHDGGTGAHDVAALIDRLINRLGVEAVRYAAPHPAHLPERQTRPLPALSAPPPDWSAWPDAAPAAPLRLLSPPQPLAAVECDAAGAPRRFAWRRHIVRIAALAGPDRRLGAWWQGDATARDYHIASDAAGRRLWLFRDLASGRWHLHGIFDASSRG